MSFVQLNTTAVVVLGPFVDDTDGKTAETGLSLTVYLSKNGGSSAARHATGAITHDRLGYYLVPLDTTDTNTPGVLTVFASPSGALPVRHDYAVLYGTAWNFLFPGEVLDVNVVTWDNDADPVTGAAAFLAAAATLANILNFFSATGYNAAASTVGTATNLTNAPTAGVDVVKLGGSAPAAANLKKWFDGTGYSSANSTIGTATNVTAPVNANMTNLGGNATDFAALQALARAAVVGAVASGTNTTTVVTTTLPSAVSGFYVGKTFVALTGANAKQGGKLVTAYDGATRRLTIEALTAPMAVLDTFVLVG